MKGEFIGEDIPDIDDPKLPDTEFISSRHFLPGFIQRRRIHPFIGYRMPVIVIMIIHAVSARVFSHLFIRDGTKVPEIIITEHQDHIF